MHAAVTLCVINHDGADRLAPAFAAALAQAGGFAEILVVDNASTDGSVALLEGELKPLVDVFARHEINQGKG